MDRVHASSRVPPGGPLVTHPICGACGEAASATVSFRLRGQTLLKDLCSAHLAELLRGAVLARRGRSRKRKLP